MSTKSVKDYLTKRIGDTEEFAKAAGKKRKKDDVVEPNEEDTDKDEKDEAEEEFILKFGKCPDIDQNLKRLANKLNDRLDPFEPELRLDLFIDMMQLHKDLSLKYLTIEMKDGKKNLHITKSKLHMISKMFFQTIEKKPDEFFDQKHPRRDEVQQLCTKVRRHFKKSKFDPVKEWLDNPQMDDRGKVPEDIEKLIGSACFKKKSD